MAHIILIGSLFLFINLFVFAKEVMRKEKTNITYFFLGFNTLISIGLVSSLLQEILIGKINPMFFEILTMSCIYLLPPLLLILYLLFIKKNLSSNLSFAFIFLIPSIFIALIITNPYTHLMYDKFSLNLVDLNKSNLYKISFIFTELTFIGAYLVLFIGNYKNNYLLSGKKVPIALNAIITIILLKLTYLGIIKGNQLTLMFILTLHGVMAYFWLIRYQYVNAVPFGLESSINFLNSSVMVIDVHGEIVYSNELARSFIKNILGIRLKITNLFELLSAFDQELTNNIKYGLKNLYKVNGLMIQTDTIYGLKGKLYLQLQMYEVKGTEYYLLILRDVNQQHKELLDIQSKQNVINMQSQLATVGELALGVVHDINTPISALNTAIEILKSTQLTDTEKEILNTIDISAKKIAVIASSIKDQFKNADSKEKVEFNLSLFINQTIFNIQRKLDNANCKVELDLDDSISILGNQSKLSQIFMNVIFNSIKAYTEKNTSGPIFIKTVNKGNEVCIEIKDNAGGIPENLRPHIFNNILTTKGTKGFGLGLYISNSIVQGEFNGRMDFECEGDSTIIHICIPCNTN